MRETLLLGFENVGSDEQTTEAALLSTEPGELITSC
jgi:hypothetical protein